MAKKKLVPKEKLNFRIGVYGIIVNDGKILLVKTESIGKYFFPGGGIERGENVIGALNREILEETGIEVEIENFFMFKEKFFYHDLLNKAYQHYYFFYICKPKTFDLLKNKNKDRPRWVDLKSLKIKNFQHPMGDVFEKVLEVEHLLNVCSMCVKCM